MRDRRYQRWPALRISKSACVILALLVWSLSVRAQPSFAGLIVYALDNEASYLLLESRADAVNVRAGFTAISGWADLEEVRVDAIQRAVSASRCYFSIAGFERIVELTYFRQPRESPAYIVFFRAGTKDRSPRTGG